MRVVVYTLSIPNYLRGEAVRILSQRQCTSSSRILGCGELTIEEGSTNVYADLGYAEAAEMQRKSQLSAEIARAIKARRMTQQEAAELLGIDQSKVSRICSGQSAA